MGYDAMGISLVKEHAASTSVPKVPLKCGTNIPDYMRDFRLPL